MANTTKNLARRPFGKDGRDINLPVKGATRLYDGALIAQDAATGCLVPANTANSGPAVGVMTHEVDNTSGADAAKRAMVEYDRIFEFPNGTAANACSEATPLFSTVYMGDDHTIFSHSAGNTLQPAGRFMGMNEDGTVRVHVGAAGMHSSLGQGSIVFSLNDFREVSAAGDVSNIAANGGLLASDTTPILRGDTLESQEIAWAAGNADIVLAHTTLPADFDGTSDAYLELWVYTDNTGGGGIEAASFTVETSWDGGAIVSDAATDGTPAVTIHKVTATIAAADIPNAPSFLTVMLTPGTHANDPTQLVAARLTYKRKP